MFEAAELGRTVSKDDYRALAPPLRADLLDVQVRLRDAKFPVILVFAGVGGAGKGETVNLLNEWMDPRWLVTRAFGTPSEEERERPEYWRYWLNLPQRGRIGMYLSSWYSTPVLDRVYRRIDAGVYAEQLNRIVDFERTLADSGALILKFWMHLDKARQEERLTRLEKDPLTRWRVTKQEWKHWRMYDRFLDAAERAIRHTSRGAAPWVIVEGADPSYRSLAVATAVRDAIRQRLDAPAPPEAPVPHVSSNVTTTRKVPARASARVPAVQPPVATTTTILGHLDMKLRLDKKDAARKIEQWQGRLNQLQRKAAARGVSTVLVFEGWDAAGKGGAIRRITSALDAREYQVIQIAVPTDEERAHHYLWRFWRHLSRAGRVTLFDRSWYGRVLVERVEGFATEPEWMRAYGEINQFEEQLVSAGTVLVKYWLHVTPDEQLRRFKDRQATAWKQWKITDEDWRNRKQWPAYELAVNDMVERTSTHAAPWTLIEADDKAYARVKVLRTACDRLREALE